MTGPPLNSSTAPYESGCELMITTNDFDIINYSCRRRNGIFSHFLPLPHTPSRDSRATFWYEGPLPLLFLRFRKTTPQAKATFWYDHPPAMVLIPVCGISLLRYSWDFASQRAKRGFPAATKKSQRRRKRKSWVCQECAQISGLFQPLVQHGHPPLEDSRRPWQLAGNKKGAAPNP